MRRWILASCLLAASPPSPAARHSLDLEVDGASRRILVFAPDTPGAHPPPTVVMYHGMGDDSAAFARAVRLHRDWPEAVVAYPRGEMHQDRPMRGWQYRRGQYDDRDLKLTRRLVAELQQRFGSRPESTFAAGFSNGGHFLFLLMAEQPQAFAAYSIVGAVQPGYASDAAPRPLLYLFGRGEDREYQDDWQQTVERLVRHQRTTGPLFEALGCCRAQLPGEGGAPLVFGLYNAGHIWPEQGNAWLREFFSDPWFSNAAR